MRLPILLRRTLLGLVIGLPLTVVVYAITMGGAVLLATLGDPNGALGLRWVGTSLTMLFVAGSIVLLLLLGWERIAAADADETEEP